MKLFYTTLGVGPPLMILHGLFGSADNWRSVGKMLAQYFKVYLVDMRNHGNSPHSAEFNYSLMCSDVIELMQSVGLESTLLLGHSMGGKVAMRIAVAHPEKVTQLMVVDIAPKYYSVRHTSIFEGFHSVQLSTLRSRYEADLQMQNVITDWSTRQFLLKNLKRDDKGQFKWQLNLKSIENNIESIGEAIATTDPYNKSTLFVSGGKSDYILPSDHPLIYQLFSQAHIISIPDAGHWVHAEKPKEILGAIVRFTTQKSI